MVLEKDIESQVCNWAKHHGFLHPKVKFVENGWPDRVFISPAGKHCYIEFKQPGKRPREIQWHRIKELHKRGVSATWADSYEHAVGWLQAILDTERLSAKSSQAPLIPGVGGTLPGPRSWQDVYSPGGYKDPQVERTSLQNPYSRAPEGGLKDVARRDKEVGGVRQLDFFGPTWEGQS